MCGILGWHSPRDLAPEALREALATLVHRGPDDEGVLQTGPVVLGMRRLSIIDVEGGRQPIANEDGEVAVVANGEIYNFVELRRELEARGHRFRTRSDTEVLVHLYEERGESLCEELRGMYAFALWDARRRLLVLGRDRFGKKPLYWTRTRDGGLVFASELKGLLPLLRAAGMEPDLRPQAIYDYLSLGSVPQPSTVYEGVHCLPPASVLTFDGREPSTWSYWSPPSAAEDPRASYRGSLTTVRDLVADAVRIRLRSDVPLGVFLSGGLDSSVVAYEAARQTAGSVSAFTVAVEDSAMDESALAGETARALGLDHTVLPLRVAPLGELDRLVRHFDQPFADPSAIPSMAVARLAREHVKVVLNGDGGDEVFAGYRRYLAALWADRIGALIPAPGLLARLIAGMGGRAERRSSRGFAARFLRGLPLGPGARYLAWTVDMLLEGDKRRIWRGGVVRPTEDWVEARLSAGVSSLDQMLAGDRAVNLLSDLLVKMDMATMASSLEARSPLLDHRVAELVLALPPSYRLRRGRLKALLRDAYRDALPEAVIRGPKKGFEIPLERWLRTDLREVVEDTVGSPTARVRDLVDGAAVDQVLRGKTFRARNRPYLVYALLVLELWLRQRA